MIIKGSRYNNKKQGKSLFFKSDIDTINVVQKMDGNDVREMKKALRGLQFYSLRHGIRRNDKAIKTPEDHKRYIIERSFLQRFEPIEAILEATSETKKSEIMLGAYTSCFGKQTFDLEAYSYFKEMMEQLIDIYKDIIR